MNAIDVLTLVIPHLYIFYEAMKCGKTIKGCDVLSPSESLDVWHQRTICLAQGCWRKFLGLSHRTTFLLWVQAPSRRIPLRLSSETSQTRDVIGHIPARSINDPKDDSLIYKGDDLNEWIL